MSENSQDTQDEAQKAYKAEQRLLWDTTVVQAEIGPQLTGRRAGAWPHQSVLPDTVIKRWSANRSMTSHAPDTL